MTTYVVTDYDGCGYITAGKRYEAKRVTDNLFEITDDDGRVIIIRRSGSSRLHGRDWTVIEEPDTPKTWREMTDAEKGALLLAHHEGKAIESKFPKAANWLPAGTPAWVNGGCYRIKPEPVVGEVALNGADYNVATGGGRFVFDSTSTEVDTHTLTLPTLDGQLVTGEFANEDGMKVVIEEKK